MLRTLALLLLTAGCDGAEPFAPSMALTFTSVEDADGFTMTEPGTQVVRDEAAWTALWAASWGVFDGQGALTPPPAVDFERHLLVALFWGAGYSGCSSRVEAVEDVRIDDGRIVVRVGPLPDLGPCEALVYPVQILRLDQSDLRVVFEGDVPGALTVSDG